MSLENSKPNYTKKQVPVVQLPTIIPLVIPNPVLSQIKYLCKNIPKVEWSGILFYTIQGSIKKPSKMKIIIKTILPLDMGTAAFTSYDLDERFIDFLEEDFDVRSQWKVGHIHSHNVMRVFFSGTDMDELHDNAPGHDFYVSLIVNNFMDFTAKIAFMGSAKQSIKSVPFIALDEKGQEYTIKTSDYTIDDSKLFIYDCAVCSSAETIKVVESFASQTAKIMEPKPIVPAKIIPIAQSWKRDWDEAPKNSRYHLPPERKFETPDVKDIKKATTPFDKSKLTFDDDLENEELDAESSILYLFIKSVYNMDSTLTEMELDDMELEEVLDVIALVDITPFAIANIVLDNYPIIFQKMFPEASPEDFIIITYDVLGVLEEEIGAFPELKMSIKLIETMIEKFMENERSTSKI